MVSESTTATQKAYIASRPRIRSRTTTAPASSSLGESSLSPTISSSCRQTRVQLTPASMATDQSAQKVSQLSAAVPTNSDQSCEIGIASEMLKSAMITHMTMTSVSDHLPKKASQKLALRRARDESGKKKASCSSSSLMCGHANEKRKMSAAAVRPGCVTAPCASRGPSLDHSSSTE